MTIDEAREVLGVSRYAEREAVKGAYRALSAKYHPDRNPEEPVAEARMKRVTEAFRLLEYREPEPAPSPRRDPPRPAPPPGPGPAECGSQWRPSYARGSRGRCRECDAPLWVVHTGISVLTRSQVGRCPDCRAGLSLERLSLFLIPWGMVLAALIWCHLPPQSVVFVPYPIASIACGVEAWDQLTGRRWLRWLRVTGLDPWGRRLGWTTRIPLLMLLGSVAAPLLVPLAVANLVDAVQQKGNPLPRIEGRAIRAGVSFDRWLRARLP